MIWDFQKYGNYTAILDEYGKSLTYEALDKEGRLVAEAAGRRCLAFLLCRNEIGALVGYTGMLNGGMVPLLLNSHVNREALEGLLAVYRPAYLWAPEGIPFPDLTPVYDAFGYRLLQTCYETEYVLQSLFAKVAQISRQMRSPSRRTWSWMRPSGPLPPCP